MKAYYLNPIKIFKHNHLTTVWMLENDLNVTEDAQDQFMRDTRDFVH